MNKFYFVFLFITLILVDQITKVIFANRDFFIGFMHFHLVKNYGLSFGLDFGKFNLIIICIAVILFAIYLRTEKINSALILVLTGAISNLIDRVFFEYVRDFWDIGLGFTFNLADIFIIVGLLMLLFNQSRNKTGVNSEQIVE